MRRFEFRYETLRSHRARLEEEQAALLAHLQGEAAAVKGEIAALDGRIREATAERNRHTRAGDLAAARLAQDYLHALAARREEQVARLESLSEALREARDAYLAARRDHRAVEILRQRDWEAHRLEALREEQKELDEIAGRRHG
ncbi:MAG: flagellar export protein FliJ [Nitrospirae bacterium]|nr:MAG: flagellar export protein FliJ [Nitrospirota bacterium]